LNKYILFILLVFKVNLIHSQDLNLNKYQEKSFNQFALITNQIFTSGFYHSAKAHEFGGADVGLKMIYGIIPNGKKSESFKNENLISIPSLQANIGLLKGLEIGGRYVSFDYGSENKEKVNLYSGIIKYNLINGLLFPDITIYSTYTRLNGVTVFKFDAISFGAIIGKSIPLISVYVGGNYSSSSMDIHLEPDRDLYPLGLNKSVRNTITHYALGLSVGLAPFTKLNLEYNKGEIQILSLGIILSIF